AEACCRDHAGDAGRVALICEDERGVAQNWTFAALARDANRLSNALAALGVKAGGRVAIMLAQRPETAIAHFACYQLGAIAMPLSILFGPEALEQRLADSEAVAAVADPIALANLETLRARLPALSHVVGVAGARASGTHDWQALLARASDRFQPVRTRASDPALLIYTSGT